MGLAVTKQEAFWEACGFGHTIRVKKFLEDPNIKVDWVSYTHNSCPIHVASQGKLEIVKILLDRKCKVNVLDDRGSLPLHHAAMKGHADIMQLLIDAGSEVNTQDKNGWSPLISAAYFCQPDAVDNLILNKCDVNVLNMDERTALHQACRTQSDNEEGVGRIVKALLLAGSDINLKSSDAGEADFTPLMFASYHGHPRAAQELIEAKCGLDCQGSNMWTALHWAADRGHTEVIRVLLQAGVNPLTKGMRGELASNRAQNKEAKELLLAAEAEHGGQVNGLDASPPATDLQEREDPSPSPPPVPGSGLAASLSAHRKGSKKLSIENRQAVLDEVMRSMSRAEEEGKRINKLLRKREGLDVDESEGDTSPPQGDVPKEEGTGPDLPEEADPGAPSSPDMGRVDGSHFPTLCGGMLVSYASRGSVSTTDPLSDEAYSSEEDEYQPNANPDNLVTITTDSETVSEEINKTESSQNSATNNLQVDNHDDDLPEVTGRGHRSTIEVKSASPSNRNSYGSPRTEIFDKLIEYQKSLAGEFDDFPSEKPVNTASVSDSNVNDISTGV